MSELNKAYVRQKYPEARVVIRNNEFVLMALSTDEYDKPLIQVLSPSHDDPDLCWISGYRLLQANS